MDPRVARLDATGRVLTSVLPLPTPLAATGTNLDTLQTIGTYHQATSAGATAGTNYPAPYAGILEVLPGPTDSGFVYQRYTTFRTDGRTYERNLYQGVWGSWRTHLRTLPLTPNRSDTDIEIRKVDPSLSLQNTSAGTSWNAGTVRGSRNDFPAGMLQFRNDTFGTTIYHSNATTATSPVTAFRSDGTIAVAQTNSALYRALPFAEHSDITLASFGVVSEFEIAVTFPAGLFTKPPVVIPSISSKAAHTRGWDARAISVTATGFTLWLGTMIVGSEDAAPWVSVPVQWVAKQQTP